jgi:uncharacterized damage-inducible protein DinB
MENTQQLAARFREVLLNGQWIANTNFKDALAGVTWEQATQKAGPINTIAALAFHVNYYIAGVLNVLRGGSLDIRDKYSFDMPPIRSESDWKALVDTLLANADAFADAMERMPDAQLEQPFTNEKYGTYRRNIEAMIEHCYYHLGQVSLIRKLVNS